MSDWYEFRCPSCSAAFEVDETARVELCSVGCPECGVSVTAEAFEPMADVPRLVM